MKKKITFKELLRKAAVSEKRKAVRKKLPVAISENGKVVLIYPDKTRRVVNPLPVRKKAS